MKLLEKEELLSETAAHLEKVDAEGVLTWVVEQYPNTVLACSFGAEDVVLVDMLQRVRPQTPIFYLDTDFHFSETYKTRDRLAERYQIQFMQIQPTLTVEQQAEQYGDELWLRDPNQCCNLRKVQPLTQILSQYEAWITGIRREQAWTRMKAQKIEFDSKFGLVKCNPLADWTSNDVWAYIRKHDIPYNPLHDQNYPSIGCSYCTRPVDPGQDPRSGRWSGTEKTECGLHR